MYLFGLLLVLGSLAVGGKAAHTLYIMYDSGAVTAPMWAPEFWFLSTNYRSGITPEAKQLLIVFASFLVFMLGRHLMNLGDTEEL